MAVEQRVRSILRSAELTFELGVMNATRFGPLIHANVPDYAEILLRVYAEENQIAVEQADFPGLVEGVGNFIGSHLPGDQESFRQIGEYFVETRRAFRNPLHHTDRVQGYVIVRSEALRCLLQFNGLLLLLFPAFSAGNYDELNYPCYVQFIKLEYNQSLGRNNPRYYQAVISALQRLEHDNDYRCPPDFDSSRLIAITQLYRLGQDAFTRAVLNYRPELKGLVVEQLRQSAQPLSCNQLLPRLKHGANSQDLALDELERCLAYMEGESLEAYGMVVVDRSRTSSGNPILRYRLVP